MSAKGQCFTAQHNGLSRVLLSDVQISTYLNEDGTEHDGAGNKYTAIWDTGATGSLITPKVVSELKLLPTGKILANNTHGQQEVNVYCVNVILPNMVRVQSIQAIEGTPNGCDVLIGMDVITLGDFAVSNLNGNTSFSFRIPSLSQIDFTESSYMRPTISSGKIGRNDPCACGSGMKYKHCCGK